MKQRIISVITIGGLLLILLVLINQILSIDKANVIDTTSTSSTTVIATIPPAAQTTVPVTVQPTVSETAPTVTAETVPSTSVVTDTTIPVTEEAAQTVPVVATTEAAKKMPETTKEIIDKYTQLVNDFKSERPAYKKKEYQVLPEEHRNFGAAVNILLNIASGYMVTEEECEELVRPAGSEDIRYDMPIHNSDKGCIITDYDAVSWAKCEDMGDGTYKISFSLREEVNAEPTPADTMIPRSVHGTVMQPVSSEEIMVEVDKITTTVPGIGLNEFSLYYRDCEFICIYDVQTDRVLSITHHIVIDIVADLKLFLAQIDGSARLLNEMYIYDITW